MAIYQINLICRKITDVQSQDEGRLKRRLRTVFLIAGIRAATAAPVVNEGPVGGETRSVSAVRHKAAKKVSTFLAVDTNGVLMIAKGGH